VLLAKRFLLILELGPSSEAQTTSLGKVAYSYLMTFDKDGARVVNTAKGKAAADYLCSELEKMGYTPTRQTFSEVVELTTVASENIICEKKGSSVGEIIIAAHYDSVADGNGSDDNASGISLLLETCSNLRNIETHYSIKFIFFGAEELGKVGAKYFVKNLGDEKKQVLAMLNFDSLIAGDKKYVHGSSNEKGKIRDWMIQKATEYGLELYIQMGLNSQYPKGTTGDWGDHAPFDSIGIEYAAFEATNWDLGDMNGYTQTDQKYGKKGEIWHSMYDTFAYIEKTFPGRSIEHLSAYQKLLMAFISEYRF
jgi:alkaline phosphatase isozyme conversion protein